MAIDVNGNEGDVFGFKATSGSNNMTGGEYRFNPEAGTLTYYSIDNVVEASVAEDGYIYVPVATTTNAIVAGNVEETSTDVNIFVSDMSNNTLQIAVSLK